MINPYRYFCGTAATHLSSLYRTAETYSRTAATRLNSLCGTAETYCRTSATQLNSLCRTAEARLNSRSPIPIPEGTVVGIVSSAGLSFAANLFFSRGSFRISLQGGGTAVLAKLIQMTLLVGQKYYFNRTAAQPESQPAVESATPENEGAAPELVTRAPPANPFLSPHACFVIAQLVMFCFRKITTPSIDPWASLFATWTSFPNDAKVNYESLVVICILKGKKV